jgi:segregation and condensation protein A
VRVGSFEGPFDLLLHLISRKEIDIYEVSVSEITDEYLRYIEAMRELDLEVATEFLLVAATLLKLKSEGLLPEPEKAEEEVSSAELREELLWRLVEYSKFRRVGEWLQERWERECRYLYREVEYEEALGGMVPDVLSGITLEMLREALRRLLRAERPVDVSYIAPIRVNITDFMEKVRRVLAEKGRTSFRELTSGLRLRIEVIATFLALLELFKREEVDLLQAERFGDIQVVSYRPEGEPLAAGGTA